MAEHKIVVLGAGVSGLTTALLLCRQKKYCVTVVAKHMPGDYDIEYASPWAGANYLPLPPPGQLIPGSRVAKDGTPAATYERDTWPELAHLAENLPEAGVHFQDTQVYRRSKDIGTPVGDWFAELVREDAWFSKVVPNFRVLDGKGLPEGIDGGTAFTSVCINTAIYLPWLVSQCLKEGVVFRRGIMKHVTDAADLHHTGKRADLVVNCTGLSSLFLGGVEDQNLYPARGQIVLVRNSPGGIMASVSGTDDGPDEAAYIMDRAAGGGCILGGCLQKNSWDSAVDPNLAIRIMKRAVDMCPALVPPGKGIEALDIIRHGVGLRPMRNGGIRVEKETIKAPSGHSVKIVHSIGHGGYGGGCTFFNINTHLVFPVTKHRTAARKL